MYSYKLRTFLGTFLLSGLLLAVCLFMLALPESEDSANAAPLPAQESPAASAVSSVSSRNEKFSTISLGRPTSVGSAVALAEKLNLSGTDLLASAGFEFDSDEFALSKSLVAEESAAAEDAGLEMYRQPQSRPAVEWFYTHITNSREVALAILESADRNDIPPSLAFALAYVESRYKADAVNHNVNDSIDRGLFQLNDRTFPKLTEEDFFNPRVSARYGMSHLKYCMDVAGNEISGLAMYNAGTVRVRNNTTPQQTLNYVAKISKYRKSIENRFSTEVVAFFDGGTSNALAMTN